MGIYMAIYIYTYTYIYIYIYIYMYNLARKQDKMFNLGLKWIVLCQICNNRPALCKHTTVKLYPQGL